MISRVEGERIKELRIKAGLPAAYVAKYLDIDEETYNMIEAGGYASSDEVFFTVALSYLYGVTLDYITGRIDEEGNRTLKEAMVYITGSELVNDEEFINVCMQLETITMKQFKRLYLRSGTEKFPIGASGGEAKFEVVITDAFSDEAGYYIVFFEDRLKLAKLYFVKDKKEIAIDGKKYDEKDKKNIVFIAKLYAKMHRRYRHE